MTIKHGMGDFATALAVMLLVSCSGEKAPMQPAPIGDKAALERLATEYNKLSDSIPAGPWQLSVAQRKHFVESIFEASGYSYSATLHSMASGTWDAADKNARDLAELLLMPHANTSNPDDLKGVYDTQQQADMRVLQARMR